MRNIWPSWTKVKNGLSQSIFWIFLLSYILLALLPVFWTLSTSFKPRNEVQSIPPSLLPRNITLNNYIMVLKKTPVLMSLRNSCIIVVGTILLCLLLGLPASYAFSKFNLPGQKYLVFFVIASRAVAPPALVVPFMILARKLNLIDTFYILIIIDTYMWLPFLIWLMKGFIDAIPQEIMDAAKMEGCSNIGVLFRMILPLSLTGLTCVIILMFIDTWNELLFALAFTQSPAVKPITTSMMYFYTDVYTVYGWMTASGIIGIIPALIFVLFFQRYIVKGITLGAIKG